jgi:hypothetical protein
MFALPLLKALPANQSHSRQSSDSAGQKPACPGPRQSHKPSYRAEGEPRGAIRRAGGPGWNYVVRGGRVVWAILPTHSRPGH